MYAQYDALVEVRKRAEQELLTAAELPGAGADSGSADDSDCHDAGTFSHQTTNQLPKEPLRADYQKLLAQGTKPNLAKLTETRIIGPTADLRPQPRVSARLRR
jgi:hypothetical protein